MGKKILLLEIISVLALIVIFASSVSSGATFSLSASYSVGKTFAELTNPIASSTQITGERWAIIVGVADYKYNIGDLNYSDNDAIELSALLAPIFGADHVKLLVNSEATKSNIQLAITSWLAPREDANDTVIFFFSGHGGQASDVSPIDEFADGQDEYICPYDSLEDDWSNDIRDDELNTWLNALDSQNVVVILDSCLSGGFNELMAGRTLAGDGRVILAASAESEDSYELDELDHGLFSYYLLKALSSNVAQTDLNKDKIISAEELYSYTYTKVVAYNTDNDDQHPMVFDGYKGELPLLKIS